MKFNAWFECINGCEGKHPLNEVLYRCPSCDDLLQVRHDTDALRTRSAEQWKKLFDSRFLRTAWPYGSSVWGKKEFVCPIIHYQKICAAPKSRTEFSIRVSC